MSSKTVLSYTNQAKLSQSYTFFVFLKRGLIVNLTVLSKKAILHVHPYFAIYRELPPKLKQNQFIDGRFKRIKKRFKNNV